jgi:hypothetical protein
VALAIALFAMSGLLLVASSSLSVGMSGVRATRNYRGASQVHFAAESGISEALQVINGPGARQMQADVVDNWPNLWGPTLHQFAPLAGFTLTVTPVALDANRGRLVATAYGPEGVRNTVVANVVRADIPSAAGAIYLASDTVTASTFNGNSFLVDGNDRNYTGGAGPALPVPGISTRNDTNTQATIASLSEQQRDNVTGLAYAAGPPITTSVRTSPSAPSIAQLNQIIADLDARPGVLKVSDKLLSKKETYGTAAAPQITHYTGTDGLTIKGNGNLDGAGILIIDGDLTLEGSLTFKGLVIVRGGTIVKKDTATQASGNATLYGSLWTTSMDLTVSGSAIIQYSSQALLLANQVSGGTGLPAPVSVTALIDCGQVPSGIAGCP